MTFRNNVSGRLKPSTSSFSGLVPNKASAWLRSVISRLMPNSELLTTRRIFVVSAGSFSMHSFSAQVNVRRLGKLQHADGDRRKRVKLAAAGNHSVERGVRIHNLRYNRYYANCRAWQEGPQKPVATVACDYTVQPPKCRWKGSPNAAECRQAAGCGGGSWTVG